MTASIAKAQTYGGEGPTLTRNTMGLVYEDAISENLPGEVNIHIEDGRVVKEEDKVNQIIAIHITTNKDKKMMTKVIEVKSALKE